MSQRCRGCKAKWAFEHGLCRSCAMGASSLPATLLENVAENVVNPAAATALQSPKELPSVVPKAVLSAAVEGRMAEVENWLDNTIESQAIDRWGPPDVNDGIQVPPNNTCTRGPLIWMAALGGQAQMMQMLLTRGAQISGVEGRFERDRRDLDWGPCISLIELLWTASPPFDERDWVKATGLCIGIRANCSAWQTYVQNMFRPCQHAKHEN